MKGREQYKNFIICLFVTVILLTGAGMGFEENVQVFSACRDNIQCEIVTPTLSTTEEVHIFQVRRGNSDIVRETNRYQNHSEQGSRMSFLFLFVLTVLSVCFHLIQKTFVFYNRLYVEKRYSLITFIHDTDGRKRFA